MTGIAALADGGPLDAELVRVRNASITDTATTAEGDFHFTVNDGSGPLGVVLQGFLQIGTSLIVPDSIFRISRLTGLLVPMLEGDGDPRWRLFPRGGSDLVLETRRVDLALNTTVDFPVATRNDTVTFSVVARNVGALPATGVEVVDSLPLGLTLLDATTSRGTFDAREGIWTLGEMAPGASDTLRPRTRVATSLVGTFFNRASVLPLTGELDTNPGNNAAAVAVSIVPPDEKQTDLQVEVSAEPDEALPGDTVQLTVRALNGGPLRATAVQIANSMPSGLELVSAEASAGSYDSGTGVWSLDSIAVGAIESLILDTEIVRDTPGVIVNRVRSLGTQREVDPVPTNDTASVAITVQSPEGVDVVLSMTSDRDALIPNDTVAIRVMGRNAGPFTAAGVRIVDTLPAGLAFLSAATSAGSYDPGTAVWTVGDLAASRTDTLTLRAEVVAAIGDTLTNRARSLGPAPPGVDRTPTNDTAALRLPVIAENRADVGLAIPTDGDQTIPGHPTPIRLVVTNAGPLAVEGLQIADSLADHLSVTTARTSSGNYDVATGVWTLPSLGVGGRDSLSLEVRTDLLQHFTYSGRVVALPGRADPDASDNSVTSIIRVVQARPTDLVLTARLDQGAVTPGGQVEVLFHLRNQGSRDAAGVEVLDSLLSGAEFVSAQPSSGIYRPAEARWAIDTVRAGETEELRLRVSVTAAAGDTVRIRGRSLGPAIPVVDSDPANDTTTLVLPVAASHQSVGSAQLPPPLPGDAGAPASRSAARRGNTDPLQRAGWVHTPVTGTPSFFAPGGRGSQSPLLGPAGPGAP